MVITHSHSGGFSQCIYEPFDRSVLASPEGLKLVLGFFVTWRTQPLSDCVLAYLSCDLLNSSRHLYPQKHRNAFYLIYDLGHRPAQGADGEASLSVSVLICPSGATWLFFLCVLIGFLPATTTVCDFFSALTCSLIFFKLLEVGWKETGK